AIMRKGIGNYELFNADNYYDKKGIYPWQIVDFNGLTGDSAGNDPGVKGIDEQTAVKLLQEYDTTENIVFNLDDCSENMEQRIKTDLEMLHLSRSLAKIKCDVPVSCTLESAAWDYNLEQVESKFSDLEFKNLDRYLNYTS